MNDLLLETIYELNRSGKITENGYDILDDTILTEEKIEYFFNSLFKTNLLLEIFSNEGEVNVVYENKPINGGIEFKYENVIGDIKFYTIVTLFKTESVSNKLDYDIIDILRKDKTNMASQKLKELQSYLNNNTNKYVLSFRFEDEEKVFTTTGKLKNKSVTLFGSVYRNVRQVLLNPKYVNDIVAFYMLVDKQELKRIKLYKEIMHRAIQTTKNFCLDDLSSEKYCLLYFW